LGRFHIEAIYGGGLTPFKGIHNFFMVCRNFLYPLPVDGRLLHLIGSVLLIKNVYKIST